MTRPDLRTPRPGELLRAAGQSKETASARQSRPWAAANTTAGLRAIDREMIRLDAKAMAAVEDAREHIRQAEADLAGAKDVLAALGTAETDEDITLALANYLAIDPAEVSFIGSMSDAVVAQLVITDDIITENMIATGAVTAQALNVVSTSGTGHSWRLDDQGFVAMHTSSQAAMHIDSGGIRMWDATGDLTVRINGEQNLLQGEFRTVLPSGGQGLVISEVGGLPGVRFTSTGTVTAASPGIRMTSGEGLWAQGLAQMRYDNGRFAVVTGNTNNQVNGARGPGQLSYSVDRNSPVRIAIESLYADIAGIYTVTFLAALNTRPTTQRVFAQIYRNAGLAARETFGQEDYATVTWTGWCNAGDRFDFTTYFTSTGSGTYNQGTTISVLYHGR